jgi:hypothetical protein
MSEPIQSSSSSWNLCRFLRTLAYFGVVPVFSGFQWFQQLWDSTVNPSADQQAIAYGQAETQVSSSSDVIESYAPMNSQASQPTTRLIFDFRSSDHDVSNIWGAVDDVVMGGVSQSGLSPTEQGALFSGVVSTDNSGGFASVRTRNFEPSLDLQDYTGIELRVRGDGNRYKFILRDETRWDGVGYSHSFDTVADTWTTIQIPFADFIPVFRARTMDNGQQINSGQIRAFQVMLSKFEYDGALNPTFEPGAFQLYIESISAY